MIEGNVRGDTSSSVDVGLLEETYVWRSGMFLENRDDRGVVG